MKFFIDTANVEDIKKANDMGVICGVTTNPSLIAKEGRDFGEVIREIASIVDGPISGEVKATTEDAVQLLITKVDARFFFGSDVPKQYRTHRTGSIRTDKSRSDTLSGRFFCHDLLDIRVPLPTGRTFPDPFRRISPTVGADIYCFCFCHTSTTFVLSPEKIECQLLFLRL